MYLITLDYRLRTLERSHSTVSRRVFELLQLWTFCRLSSGTGLVRFVTLFGNGAPRLAIHNGKNHTKYVRLIKVYMSDDCKISLYVPIKLFGVWCVQSFWV